MNELQIGMIGLGVVAVGGVLAYNRWQERRQRELAERVLNPANADVLLDAEPAATAAYREERDDAHERDTAPPASAAFSANAAADPHLVRSDEQIATSGSVGAPAAPTTAGHSPAYVAGGRIEPHLRADDGADETVAAPPARAQEILAPARPVPAAPSLSMAAAAAAASSVPGRVPPVAASESAAPPVRPSPPRGREPVREGAAIARDAAPSSLLLSPLIDYVAVIEAADPASAGDLLRSSSQALARVRKPVRWFGRDERNGEWELLQQGEGARAPAGGEYRRVHVGLQLVDRRGPVSDAEIAVFQRSMQDLADGLVAVVELAPAQPALVAAASLDAFCADVDIQIGLNVVSQGTAFPGSKLRALAEAAGMALDGEGRFVRRDDEGEVLFILCNQETGGFSAEAMKSMTTHGVTFLLDVPRVAHGDRVFAQMLEQARRFAATLQGVLVDDNRRPLAEGTLDPIRRAIAQSQAAMAARQIPAGGALALRLFS